MANKLFNIKTTEDEALQAQLDAFGAAHPEVQVLAFRVDDLPYYHLTQNNNRSQYRHDLHGIIAQEQLIERSLCLDDWIEQASAVRRLFTAGTVEHFAARSGAEVIGNGAMRFTLDKGITAVEHLGQNQAYLISLPPRGYSASHDMAATTGIEQSNFSHLDDVSPISFILGHELGHVQLTQLSAVGSVYPLFVDELAADHYGLTCASATEVNYALNWRAVSNLSRELNHQKISYAFTELVRPYHQAVSYDTAIENMAAFCEMKIAAAPVHLRPKGGGINFADVEPLVALKAVIEGEQYKGLRQYFGSPPPAKAAKIFTQRVDNLKRAIDQGKMTPLAHKMAQRTVHAAKILFAPSK